MRFKSRIKIEQGFPGLVFIPFLDVFILVVFVFIFSAGFLLPSGLRLNSMQATGSWLEAEQLEVLIRQDSKAYLNGKQVASDGLKVVFKEAAKRHMGLLIKAERTVPLSRVADISDLVRLAGIKAVTIGID